MENRKGKSHLKFMPQQYGDKIYPVICIRMNNNGRRCRSPAFTKAYKLL